MLGSLIAAAILVFIQVSIGLVYKLAATSSESGYEFSRASSLTISELFKFFMAWGLYHYINNDNSDLNTELPLNGYADSGTDSKSDDEYIKMSAKSKDKGPIKVPVSTRVGMMALSLAYCINNHLGFYVFT